LCEGDCATQTSTKKASTAVSTSPVVARVALVIGKVNATGANGRVRKLTRGGPLYEKDLMETQSRSFTVLAFVDETKVTLRQDTVFQIEEFSPEPNAEAQERVFFKLFKGGLRALTGLVAKKRPESFKITTPVATIGIRGTGFDLNCSGACASRIELTEPFASSSPTTQCTLGEAPSGAPSEDDGLFAAVWNGTISAELSDCHSPATENEVLLVRRDHSSPAKLSEVPSFMVDDAPRPDGVEVDFENFFAVGSDEDKPGLFVVVRDGHVALITDEEVLDLGGGESGFVDPSTGDIVRLAATPAFMAFDPVPIPEDVDLDLTSLLDYFGDGVDGPSDLPLACTIE